MSFGQFRRKQRKLILILEMPVTILHANLFDDPVETSRKKQMISDEVRNNDMELAGKHLSSLQLKKMLKE